jgi:hypothetical protein
MKIFANFAIVLALIFNLSAAQAATTSASGKITKIFYYGSGMMLIYGLTFDEKTDLTHCNGTQSGFLVPNDYANIDRLVSFLLTAKATKTTLSVKGLEVGTSCWAPTFVNSSFIDFS